MSTSDRYIARQVLFGSVAAVVALTMVFGLGNVLKRLLPLLEEGALSRELLLQFVLSLLPFAIAYTLPWGFLTAILLTFGRLSADHELLALRMSGLSMWRICRPVLLLAVALTGLCFWLNLVVSPEAKGRMQRAFNQLAREDPSLLFTQRGGNRKESLRGWVAQADRVDAETARNVRMARMDSEAGHQPTMWLFAQSLKFKRPADDAEEIELELRDGVQVERRDSAAPRDASRAQPGMVMDNLPLVVPMQARRHKPLKPNEMSLGQLREAIGSSATPEHKKPAYQTELTRRYSTSLACLAFCLVGIPLGVTAQRRETSAGFVLSLAVAVVYFAFIAAGELTHGEGGILPRILMWTPSVLFITLGAFLFHRLNRR